ncbi:MAG: hypothetical protein CMQ49_14555 [Gammaproteobacteria bacterium]|nr:hypothetical protein [Gammaproteobacteria bacterium]
MTSKRIVVCSDGTWNDPEDEIPTNVLRIARAIKPQDSDNVQQVVFYDWGVGSYYNPVVGGMSGSGMMKNIQDGYRFIVQNYDPGDEIYLFGYSRGAYTARALAGMLNKCGILKKTEADQIPAAFKFYKKKGAKPRSPEGRQWRRSHSVDGKKGEVAFLGVWDTVGALGIPTRALAFVEEKDLFYDEMLGSNVVRARHAVAIDEKRKDFGPTLWAHAQARDVKQVWFAGVHGDIGGGAKPKDGKFLGDVALAWMAREATLGGLEFHNHLHGSVAQHHKLRINRSYRGFFRVLGVEPRTMPPGSLVHRSVKRRFALGDYRPVPLLNWLAANGGSWANVED